MLDVLAPGFIFIGFAIGALIMTAVVAWIVLKRVFENQSTSTRLVTHDIND